MTGVVKGKNSKGIQFYEEFKGNSVLRDILTGKM